VFRVFLVLEAEAGGTSLAIQITPKYDYALITSLL
jgi:hypothetical protein